MIGIAGDMGNADDIARVVDEASSALGGIDILVNNAGSSPAGRIEDLDDETVVMAWNDGAADTAIVYGNHGEFWRKERQLAAPKRVVVTGPGQQQQRRPTALYLVVNTCSARGFDHRYGVTVSVALLGTISFYHREMTNLTGRFGEP